MMGFGFLGVQVVFVVGAPAMGLGSASQVGLSNSSIAELASHAFEPPIHISNRGMTNSARPSMTVRVTAHYLNPLRRATGIVSERIDQGVDFDADGGSPLYALGDGIVVAVYNWGWPNGVFIAYRLTDGPAQGHYVYASEDLVPDVSVRQSVTNSTVIGTFVAGADGGYDIETGWADGTGLGNSMARTCGQWDGYDSTALGQNFSRLLVSLGSPGGILKGTVNGYLPEGWRTWP
jgi:hypothetical protein